MLEMKPLDVDVIRTSEEGLVFDPSHVKNLSPKYFNVCNIEKVCETLYKLLLEID